MATTFAGTEFRAREPAMAVAEYRSGICNIGPEEIARRRRAGHIGVLATVIVAAGLLAFDAPPRARLIVAIPAASAASGYLQAWSKFCAGFGARGVFNFGPLGNLEHVVDAEARAWDRAKGNQIGLASLAIGAGVGIAAALLPL
jgi:hypothetical protein